MTQSADRNVFSNLLRSATCLLFDFDGPVCQLFPSPPKSVVRGLERILLKWGQECTGLGDDDPYEMLRDVAHTFRGNAKALAELHAMVEECEIAAVTVAPEPTEGLEALLRELSDRGRVLAVATNNSPRAVRVYLEKHGLAAFFGDRIFGRRNPALMKPHPDCVRRALRELRVEAGRCLMIGDSPADMRAAHACGVSFLGFAETESREAALHQDGHRVVTVRSLRLLADVLRKPGLD